MRQTQKGSKIREMSATAMDELPAGSIYQAEFVNQSLYNFYRDTVFAGQKKDNTYLVEYKEQPK